MTPTMEIAVIDALRNTWNAFWAGTWGGMTRAVSEMSSDWSDPRSRPLYLLIGALASLVLIGAFAYVVFN